MARIRRICILAGILAAIVWFWSGRKSEARTSNMYVVRYSYDVSPCHGNIVIDIDGKTDTLKELEYCSDSSRAIYMYAAGGDTIIKDDNKKVFTLRNRGKVMAFNYPDNVPLTAVNQ
jgi:hypothetical protein